MTELRFRDRRSASRAAADAVASALRLRLQEQDEVAVVVSGGSTPASTLLALSSTPLDWSRVHVVPSDERWLPVDDEHSNENMIRSKLIRNHATGARLVSLYRADQTPDAATRSLHTVLGKLPLPLAVSLLGMGEDGHFASLFPDFDGLEDALDPGNDCRCVAVNTEASPHQRISLTMSALINSDQVLLLVFGEEKRRVLERARSGESDLPVSALLRQDRAPLQVMWAP